MGALLLLRPPWWLGLLRAAAVPRATGDVDAEVVARARTGDHAAFAEIVRHYDHRLRGLAFRLLGDRNRMDDVLQDAYVKAFRSLPKFKGESALGTWLYRITYNACIDDLRRRPAMASIVDDSDRSASLADPRPGPDDIAIDRSDLAAALGRLPPDQRAAVLLVDAYGLDYADAAEALGVRTGTVGSRLNRARAALREALDGSAGEGPAR
ncbi:MAG: sigma-70 family RNA polymerase sigma factor [Actinomycetota bacterium]|nr:sigma-70 family RNA polymerase sigma factor [Actinomycetota bacterium]